MRRLAAGLAVAALAVAVVFAVTLIVLRVYLDRPLNLPPDGIEIVIAPGTPLAAVATDLAGNEVLAWPRIFGLYARYTDAATRVKAGEYRLEPGLTPAGLLQKLVAGRVLLHPVILLEGWTVRDIAAAFSANDVLTLLLPYESPQALASALGLDEAHAEGLFFPDTYMIPRGSTDVFVLQQANALLQQHLADAWESRVEGLPLRTPYELLILASIIERETGVSSERGEVAGVFVRRLQRGMRLQTDPTVIYGVGDAYQGAITRTHLATDTPYNTYTRDGLPPTPIALASKASLQAAANPAPGTSLYFVASGNADGSHVFSDTLEQHNAAVAAYRRALRMRMQSGQSEGEGEL